MPSKPALWTARVLSSLVILFLAFDAIGKLVKPAPVVASFDKLGIPIAASVLIGMVLLFCTVLYAIPRTSILGAVLLTAYLGGAVAIHVRAQSSTFELCFPVLFGILAWSGLYLRNPSVRTILPLTPPF